MKPMRKQHDLMIKHFGRNVHHRCGECSNFARGQYHGKWLQKCERYGLSHSEATDWAQKWPACGMFDVAMPENDRPLMEYLDRRRPCRKDVPGQMSLFEEGGGG